MMQMSKINRRMTHRLGLVWTMWQDCITSHYFARLHFEELGPPLAIQKAKSRMELTEPTVSKHQLFRQCERWRPPVRRWGFLSVSRAPRIALRCETLKMQRRRSQLWRLALKRPVPPSRRTPAMPFWVVRVRFVLYLESA